MMNEEIGTLDREFEPDRDLLVTLKASEYHYITRISNSFQLALERENVFHDYDNTKPSPWSIPSRPTSVAERSGRFFDFRAKALHLLGGIFE